MKKKLQLLTFMFAILGLQTSYGQLKITEIRVHANGANEDYIEIKGVPGSTIPANTKIFSVTGSLSNPGGVSTRVQDLGGKTIPDNGFFTLGRDSIPGIDLDIVTGGILFNAFENQTILLVEEDDFIVFGSDIDHDDDGIIDSVFWINIIDGIGLVQVENADLIPGALTKSWDYSGEFGVPSLFDQIGGNKTLFHAHRNPVTDVWETGDRNGNTTTSIVDTPGEPNTLIVSSSMSITATDTVFDVVVNSGQTLTIASGATLIVGGKIVNNGSLVIESGGSLIDTTGTYVGNALTINRTTQHSADALRHSLVSAPVAAFNLETLAADSYYEYNEATDDWSVLVSDPVMVAGQAYSVVGKTDLSFSGTPNSGAIAVSATASAYKMLGNPYPCAISIDSFFTTNTAALAEETLWLWNDNGSEGGQRTTTDYLTVNSLGEAQSGGTGAKASTNFTDGYIGSMQGFFVSTGASGTSLSFDNNMKQTGNNSDASFFRKAETDQKLKLILRNDDFFSETLLAFLEDASYDIDTQYEASKLNGSSEVQLASVAEGKLFAIAANPMLITSDVTIPLSFSVEKSGDYTFSLSNLENIPDDYKMVLVDSENNKIGSIDENSDYTFSSDKVSNSSRFSLLLTKNVITSIDDSEAQSFQISGNENLITIESLETNADIKIHDLSGSLVFEQNDATFTNHKVNIKPGLSRDKVYILSVNDQSIKFILN